MVVSTADGADIGNGASYNLFVPGSVEAALKIRRAITPDEIALAVTVD